MGICLTLPNFGFFWVLILTLNTLEYPKMGIRYFFLCILCVFFYFYANVQRSMTWGIYYIAWQENWITRNVTLALQRMEVLCYNGLKVWIYKGLYGNATVLLEKSILRIFHEWNLLTCSCLIFFHVCQLLRYPGPRGFLLILPFFIWKFATRSADRTKRSSQRFVPIKKYVRSGSRRKICQ